MNNILIKFMLCILAFLCTSCFKEVDLGFPATVTFSKEGGTKTVTGDVAFTNADIHDYKTGEQGEETWGEDGTRYNSYKWLKVEYKEYKWNSKELTIYAEPNTTGKSRKLYIELYSGPEYHVITVVQD